MIYEAAIRKSLHTGKYMFLLRRDEVRQALDAYYDDPDEDLVGYALGIARSGDGQLRTLYNDLARAEEYARSKGRKIQPADLKMFAKWRKSSGAWPEDK